MRYRNQNLVDCVSLLSKENKEILEALNTCMKSQNKYFELYDRMFGRIKTIQNMIIHSSLSNDYKEDIDSIICLIFDDMKDVI